MEQQIFYSTKSTGTYTDTLAAFGLAEILKGIQQNSGARAWSGERVWLRDDGPYYVIELDKPLPDDWAKRVKFFSPVAPITTTKQPWQGEANARDYGAEWDGFKKYQETVKQLREAARKAGIEPDLPEPPPPDFWVLAFLGDYKMQALNGYNKAIKQWEDTREHFITNLETVMQLVADPYPDVETISQQWAKAVKRKGIEREITASQLFNPTQGQGQNHPKANKLNTRQNMDSFWLLEFLKAVGLWKCAVPRTVRGGSDRKTYVVSPKRVTLGAHEDVFPKFGAALWNETAVKMDIFAALQYANVLLDYSEQKRVQEGRVPDRVMAGLHVTTYKLLSQNAYTTMNLAFIGIPEWIGEISNREEAKAAQAVIAEHLKIIGAIEEGHSDGYQLLDLYRDFLSSGLLTAFFDFTISYTHYLTTAIEDEDYRVRPFTIPNLRRLFMAADIRLKDIIDNPGFQEVAYAIRRATVTAQYRKNKKERYQVRYDVRYGLGQQIARKADYPNEFMAELAKFMHEYNAETAQTLEGLENQYNNEIPENIRKQTRRRLETRAIDEIARLIDETKDSRLICNLLIAYGYARESKEDDDKS